MPKLTNALLKRAAAAASRQADLNRQLTEAFEERYGKTYSEVDADSIIDALDYGHGPITLAECDQHMAIAGAPALIGKDAG